MLNEFGLIKHYFEKLSIPRKDVALGIGDDAAVVNVPKDQQLVITTDTLISGVHFPKNAAARDIGYKSLAVNLSDLAAMGATPSWVTLALTLPTADEHWLREFTHGFSQLATPHNIQLIGGDLTKGLLSITITAFGFVPPHLAITRSGATPGDLIYVSNTLGDAALGLAIINNKISATPSNQEKILKKYYRPEPQISLGEKLRGIASAAIDISDGLAADLSHILEKSQVGAEIDVEKLPLSIELLESVSYEQAISLPLSGGDDYELCFTVPENKVAECEKVLANYRITCIGKITHSKSLDVRYDNGKKYEGSLNGFKHF